MIKKFFKDLSDPKMEPITGMDATFLYGETPNSPMHIGSVGILEGSLSFDVFRSTVLSRIHLIPKLRKRLVTVPMGIDYPYWVDDPDFDIDMHLNHIALPRPGGWKELRAVASQIFSEHLDRNRPLWSFTFIEGIDDIGQVPKGSVAIVSKMHHVAVDGMAGAGILSLIFDMSPKPRKISPPKPFNPEPIPNQISMILKSSASFAKRPFKFPRMVANTVTASLKAGVLSRVQRAELPTAPFTAPSTPLNGIISAQRKWNAAILDLGRIKALKKIMGTKMNDIMLAICAGALRRYLLEKNKLPPKPLVSLVPISVRTKEEEQTAGNKLSAMLIQLATNIEDPIERLETIYANTLKGKSYQGAMGAQTLTNMAEAVPFGIANQAARLYSRYQMAEMHKPAFNVLITNVPGPQFPIYLNGHKLVSIMGMAPIIDGMGLIITIFSYDGKVMVSPTSDAKTMPDLNTFTRYIRESANELEAAVLALADKKKKEKEGVKSDEAPSDAWFEHIKSYLKTNPDKVSKKKKGLYQFMISGPCEAIWKIDFNKRPIVIRRGKAAKPDLSLKIEDDHLLKIGKKELDLETAIIQGRATVEGDKKMVKSLGDFVELIPALEN
ncbi:MAG: wax ester/triacylglycerol synthase family O-acyltransferase [Bacteroidota bacterium]